MLNRRLIAICVVLAACALGFQSPIEGQRITERTSTELVVAPEGTLKIGAGTLRTQEMMQEDELAATFAVANNDPVPPHNFPTPSPGEYEALKSAAKANLKSPARQKLPASKAPGPGPLVPPTYQGVAFFGGFQGQAPNPCGCYPPDTHGAVGNTQYVQIINSVVRVYNKAGGLLAATSLNTFFGYGANLLFDPRALYDAYWDRWVLTAEGSPEGGGAQYQFIAISTTSSATGGFIVYAINVSGFSGGFWDYPDVGMDIDSIQITANRFNAAGTAYFGSAMFAMDKAILYNALGFSTPVFFTPDTQGTLRPTVVLDTNRVSSFAAAPPSGSTVYLYRLRDSGRFGFETFLFTGGVVVPAYSAPPDAAQPGTAEVLDTLDARFQNAGGQIGAFLYQVHSIAVGPSAVQWYRININTATLASSGVFFLSASDALFNPSVAIDAAQRSYFSISRTDAPAGVNAQHLGAGKLVGDANIDAAVVTMFTSGGALTGNKQGTRQRWGDYSSVSMDPTGVTGAGNPIFWITNEVILGAATWGTVVGTIGY